MVKLKEGVVKYSLWVGGFRKKPQIWRIGHGIFAVVRTRNIGLRNPPKEGWWYYINDIGMMVISTVTCDSWKCIITGIVMDCGSRKHPFVDYVIRIKRVT